MTNKTTVDDLLKDFQYQVQDISVTQTYKTELRKEFLAALLALLESKAHYSKYAGEEIILLSVVRELLNG